jgi:hypothetical protein
MGKLIVPLIIGLLLGVSGGGFYAVTQAAKAHATAVADAKKHGIKPAGDSTQAEGDSSHAADSASHEPADVTAHAETDSAHVEAPPAGAAPVASGATTPVKEAGHGADSHATPATTPVVLPSPADPTRAASTTRDVASIAETQAHQRRLAKIFATMGAKDAARVLAQMTDHDVSIILGLLADRQAAAILTNLPAPRAAALSAVQPRRGGTE